MACRKLAEQLKNADKTLFAQLAKANSDAPNAETGGKVGFVDADKLRPEFGPAVKGMKPGAVVGPLTTPEGFYFIRLDAVLPEEKIPFEKAADDIRRKLENLQKEELRRAYGEKLKKQALIRYYF